MCSDTKEDQAPRGVVLQVTGANSSGMWSIVSVATSNNCLPDCGAQEARVRLQQCNCDNAATLARLE